MAGPIWTTCCSSLLLLLWVGLVWGGTPPQVEEVELFHSDKQSSLAWTSEPPKEWIELKTRIDSGSVPVLQACGKREKRSVFTQWLERKDAQFILVDVSVAQEEEESGQTLSPLRVHLFESDRPLSRLYSSSLHADIQTSSPFPASAKMPQILRQMNSSTVRLGPINGRGFQVAFSYTGACVFLKSIRLYYGRCPSVVSHLVFYNSTAAGSALVFGHCATGAVQVSIPSRECDENGQWGPPDGACACGPGHELKDNSCRACMVGYYKAAKESSGCRLCPPNTRTTEGGADKCQCMEGFSRLPSDHLDLGCAKPPSAPTNVTAWPHNESALLVTWDPPHDTGGREDLTYSIQCEMAAGAGSQWEECEDSVLFLPDSNDLINTSVIIVELKQCDYRLSVRAWNSISKMHPEPRSSTATVAVHRWESPAKRITVIPDPNISGLEPTQASSPHRSILFIAALLSGSLLLATLGFITVLTRCKIYKKLRSEQDQELLPFPENPIVSFQRSPIVEPVMQQFNYSGVNMLEELGDRFLNSLRDVLVDRRQVTLGKELGKGQFGSVFEGIFTGEDGVAMRVAVKTMRDGLQSQPDLHEFLKEAEIMKNFDHENVIKLLGITLKKEQDSPQPVPLVILPYMKHGDLRRFLLATVYGEVPMILLRFMVDIAAGMDYLSSKGFLHRDLAARNCMLGDDLRVCVANFGLSKSICSSNYYRQKVAIRVPIKWISIESLSESIYTTKSDVWSFGVTMWEIASRGKTPYPGVHNHELLDLLMSGHRLRAPADCDHKLYEIMQSCWLSEPSRRPDFGALLEALKCLLSELPVLEASQEATYINQGLDAAAAASGSAAASQDLPTDSNGRSFNLYLPCPLAADASSGKLL